MTALVAGTLLALAVLDGSFSGFRSSVGRTGLIDHRRQDVRAAWRGAGLSCVLLAPVVLLTAIDVLARPARLDAYLRAGTAMLIVYGCYAAIVLAALLGYAVLSWRLRYLASAVILGPCTLLRPVAAALGVAVAVVVGFDLRADLLATASVVAVLAVEPLANRVWYSSAYYLNAAPTALNTRLPQRAGKPTSN